MESGAKGTAEIENYKNWLFVSLRNFSNNKRFRQMIDDELCVGHHDTALPSLCSPEDSEEEQVSGHTDGMTPVETGTEETMLSAPSRQAEDDGTAADSRTRLSRYLDLMPHQKYARLIRLLILEGRSREEVLLELDIPEAQLYNNVNRAMVQLVAVALPEIQRRCRKLFSMYAETIKDKRQRELLADFFRGASVEKLAMRHQMTRAAMAKNLATLYRELLKNIRRDPLLYSQDDEKDDI